MKRLKIVQIIPDDRDVRGQYDVASPFFGSAPTALLEGFESLVDEVDVHIVSCVRRVMPAPEKLGNNIYYHQIVLDRGPPRTFFAEPIKKVNGLLKSIRPDVVHGQGTEMFPGMCAAFSSYPNCITIHGNMRQVARKTGWIPFPHRHITAAAEYFALKKADAVVCNSSYTDQCVGRLNHNKLRIFNAVRSCFFELQCSESDNLTFLCSGTVVEYKNQINLIHALDDLGAMGRLRILFAGSCGSSAYATEFLDLVSRRDWCEYVGMLSLPELLLLMQRVAGVVHPTLEDSFGLAIAEAQAAGIPVAASAIGGIPDLIRNDQTGLLFNPHDPSDIRTQVIKLLDHKVAVRIASNAKVFAETEYRPIIVGRKHLEYYSKILNQQ